MIAQWIKSYGLLLYWQFLRLKFMLPLIVVVQIVIAAGIVIGFAFLIPDIDKITALYLATGAPTVVLVSTGLVVLPQMIGQTKLEGSFEYVRSWPVPRLVYLAADATVWFLVTLPGLAISQLVAMLRFDLDYSLSFMVIPAFLLVALTATAVGYAMATVLPPMVSSLLTQVIIFGVFLFSPVNFPAERLPDWLAELHKYLPVQYMAEVIRGSLAGNIFQVSNQAYWVLGAWFLVGFTATYAVMTRRH
jgi:ABC-2 type transport system permease protein